MKEEKNLLEQWYRRDDNAVPPVYLLQPRTGEFIEHQHWEKVETKLRQTFQSAIKKISLSSDAALKYTTSATEQEIVAGALNVSDANEHVFCFLRDIKGMPDDVSATSFRETEPEAARKQVALKKRLKKQLSGNVHEYTAEWQGDGPSQEHLDQLCTDVFAELSKVILAETGKLEKVDSLEAEIAAHDTFGKERARIFIGRENIRKAIADYVAGSDPHPLAIWGASGSGKSALMAKAIEQLQKSGQDVFYRFIGATPESSNGRALLESLCKQISRRYGVDESTIPSEYKDLVQEFPKRLALAESDKPLVLFLDALDQLSDTDNVRNLIWLPADLPPNVYLVVSTLDGDCLQALESKLPAGSRLEVQPMPVEEGKNILTEWLSGVDRQLQKKQEEYLLGKFQKCGLPLYLKLAFEEARLWKSYDALPELSEDIPGILGDLFTRLSRESNHGGKLVSHSLGYLAAAKHGLAEDELLDVLSRDQKLYRWFLDTVHHIPDDLVKAVINYLGPDRCKQYQITGSDSEKQRKAETWFNRNIRSNEKELSEFLASVLPVVGGPHLPVVLWSRFYFDLEPYLTERSADGTSLLAFYHTTSFKKVITENYLSGEEKSKRHLNLANYFESQPLYHASAETDKPNLRKLSEMVYHQAWAGLGMEVEKTLLDYCYLEAKLAGQGVKELIEDYALVRQAGVSKEKEESLTLLQSALRLSAHVLSKDPLQLPSQLTGRLLGVEQNELDKLLEQARQEVKRPWLRPLHPCLAVPGGVLIRTLEGHTYSVYGVAVTPDGRCAVSASTDKTLKVWDLESGICLRTLEGHTDCVNGVAVTPDGRCAVSASTDKTLKVWDLESGTCLRTLEGHTGPVSGVAVTPDSRCAVSVSKDGLKVWDLESGTCLNTLEGDISSQNGVALTLDGRAAIMTAQGRGYTPKDFTLNVWDLQTGACLQSLEGHTNFVECVAATPDGHCAVSVSRDQSLKVWDLESGVCLRTVAYKYKGRKVNDIALTLDGRRAILVPEQSPMIVMDIESGNCLLTLETHIYEPSSAGVNSLKTYYYGNSKVAVTPDGCYAVSASDQTLKVWNLDSKSDSRLLAGHTGEVQSVVLTPDGRCAVTASIEEPDLKVWDLESGACLRKLREGYDVYCMAWSSDGRYAVIASERDFGRNRQSLGVWDVENGTSLRYIEIAADHVIRLALTPEDRYAVFFLSDGTIGVWDWDWRIWLHRLRTYQPMPLFGNVSRNDVIALMPDGRNVIRSGTAMALMPDGRCAVSASADNMLNVWDLESGTCLRTLIGHTDQVNAVALTPDGCCAVSASTDKTLKVWDLNSGTCLHTLIGHSDEVNAVALTPDGCCAVSASTDNMLKAWDLESGTCLASFSGESKMAAVGSSSAGLNFVAGDHRGTVYFLQIENTPSAPPVLTALRKDGGVRISKIGQPRNEVINAGGMQFCHVPAGEFLMGSPEDSNYDNEKPQHTIFLPEFWISQYPVTNEQFDQFVKAGGYERSSGFFAEAHQAGFWKDGKIIDGSGYSNEGRGEPKNYGDPFNYKNHPVVGVNWYEALAFTYWLEKQIRKQGQFHIFNEWEAYLHVGLPSEAEWEKAARGTDGREYPWGNEFSPNKANMEDSGIGTTSAVGCFANGASPYGLQDMSGNVWEWTRSLNGKYPYPISDMNTEREWRENLKAREIESRIARGGCYLTDAERVRCATREWWDASYENRCLGFRVVVSQMILS